MSISSLAALLLLANQPALATVSAAEIEANGTLGSSFLQMSRKHRSVGDDDNLYGSSQSQCGSSMCGIDPPAIHAICVSLPADFCTKTKQPDWCSAETAQPHCVCLGAWSLYVKGGNAAPNVDCDAIPGSIFSDDYIGSWSTWNGNEIHGQEAKGLEKLFDACNKGSAASSFKGSFCTFIKGSKKLSSDQISTLSSHATCS